MDIESDFLKANPIDLEDSPFGDHMVKLEAVEFNFSQLSLDLFHANSVKKEECIAKEEHK